MSPGEKAGWVSFCCLPPPPPPMCSSELKPLPRDSFRRPSAPQHPLELKPVNAVTPEAQDVA